MNQQIGALGIQHEAQMNTVKAELERLKENQSEESKKATQDTLTARQNERQKHIDLEAQKTAKRKRRWYFVFFFPCALAPIIALIWVWINYGQAEKVSEGTALVLPIIVTGASVVFEFLVYKLLYENLFCELKLDKIEEREKKKLDKEYPAVK